MGHDGEVAIPDFRPMLATNDGPRPRDAVIEPKWDGVRALITLHPDGRVTIRSRTGRDVTASYPELTARPASLEGRDGVFDGEIIAVDDEGRPTFQRMQRRMNVARPSAALVAGTPVYFVVFDLLWLDGVDLTTSRLAARRGRLEEVMAAPAGNWQLTTRFPGPLTDDMLAAAADAGLEGFILKGDGIYRPGQRSRDWLKVKLRRTMNVVVGGRATDSSSLSIGVHHEGELHYIGQVGMAMPQRDAQQLDALLKTIRRPTSPFVDLAAGAPVMFVDPLIVLEVSYLEVTDAGTLRQPIFQGVRPGVDADTAVADAHLAAALAQRTQPITMRSNAR